MILLKAQEMSKISPVSESALAFLPAALEPAAALLPLGSPDN